MQRRLMTVVILFLVGASAAAADTLCRTTYRTITSRSVDTMLKVLDLLSDIDMRAVEVMAARGEVIIVEPDTDIYLREDRGNGVYLVRLAGSPDLSLALAPKGFDCPTPAPKRPTKKPKRP